jgi:hypothetical protein
MLLLAFAEAAQHGMQEGVPKTTDAKNKTGWRLWEQFLHDIGGNTPLLRQPDLNPRHMLREQLLKICSFYGVARNALLFYQAE